jgi:hypothetical protein
MTLNKEKYRIEFMIKNIFGRDIDFSNVDSIVLKCIDKAYMDMLSGGRFYVNHLEGFNKKNIITNVKQILEKFNYKYSIEMLNETICLFGNKEKIGDMKTPEGVFHVSDIQNSSQWSHDFKDGLGEIAGAYGPHFIRLEVPGHKGIGIHGTHKPESIGTRDTEGCIRLNNNDIEELINYVSIGMVVVIIPSQYDVINLDMPQNIKKKSQQTNPVSRNTESTKTTF